MTRTLDLKRVLDERPECWRDSGVHGPRKTEQFVNSIEACARKGSWLSARCCHRRRKRGDEINQLTLGTGRPSTRIVAPRLHERQRHHAVANDVDTQWTCENLFAPLATEVPIVGDVVIVRDHIGRDVRQSPPHTRQPIAEPAKPPLEECG